MTVGAGRDDSSNTDVTDQEASLSEQSLLQKVVRKGLVDVNYDIEVQRQDPKSPLHSVKSFDALHLKPQLLKGVYGMGFNAPSKIQETALPALLADPPQVCVTVHSVGQVIQKKRVCNGFSYEKSGFSFSFNIKLLTL